MKKVLFTLIFTLSVLFSARAAAEKREFFTQPVPPDSMMVLQDRCDYIVNRFWDRCNFGIAFKEKARLNEAFGQWVSIMPYASADSVFAAATKLMDRFAKNGPETLALAQMAEGWMYSDTASVRADEVYLIFAKAAANSRKLNKAEKARYKTHAQIIESSGRGKTMPAIPIFMSNGAKSTTDELKSKSVLLFFNDPDCMDCSIARVRLSTDYNIRDLIQAGELVLVSVYPGETSEEGWVRARNENPAEWVTVAMPAAYDYFDLRKNPTLVFMNGEHTVIDPNIPLDYILGTAKIANEKLKSRNERQE